MLIGITGRNASGKTLVCRYLESKGFRYFSLSDELREISKEKNINPSRNNLIKLGRAEREKNGAGFLAKSVLGKITKGDYVIDSIRSPYEVKELRKAKDFTLIGVDSDIETRFERLKKRNRPGDPKTLEELKEFEKKENSKDENSQQLDETFKLADKIISNDATIDDLKKKIDVLLEDA